MILVEGEFFDVLQISGDSRLRGYGRFKESKDLVVLKLCSFPWGMSLSNLCRSAG